MNFTFRRWEIVNIFVHNFPYEEEKRLSKIMENKYSHLMKVKFIDRHVSGGRESGDREYIYYFQFI